MREQFSASIICGTRLPAKVTIEPLDSGGYIVSGTFANRDVDPDIWQEPPHVAFANVNLDDSTAAVVFTKTYGAWHSGWTLGTGTTPPEGEFRMTSTDLQGSQSILRDAWRGSRSQIHFLEELIEDGMEARVLAHSASVELSTKSLSTFSDFLFLRDMAAEKLGVCRNPRCLTPYFIKRRETQKFCDSQACAAFAAKTYSKRWWDSRGSRLRKKNRRKQRRRRK
jgi:hypothetical protein